MVYNNVLHVFIISSYLTCSINMFCVAVCSYVQLICKSCILNSGTVCIKVMVEEINNKCHVNLNVHPHKPREAQRLSNSTNRERANQSLWRDAGSVPAAKCPLQHTSALNLLYTRTIILHTGQERVYIPTQVIQPFVKVTVFIQKF